jgi:hypothetical protein
LSLPEAGGHRVHGSADDARKSKDRATQEPELFKPPTTAPSPSRTPCFLFTVLFTCLSLNRAEPGSASIFPECFNTASPPHPWTRGEHHVSLLAVEFGLRVEQRKEGQARGFICAVLRPLSRTAPLRRPVVA